jgi:predicted dehydrogenase
VLRAAVVGCGAFGGQHAAAYAACAATELAAVWDVDRARAEACGARWGAPVRDDLAGVDLVSVCTPDPTHAELVERALTAPGVRAVLAEKPLALDAGSARRLAALARERGVVLAVNHSRRFAPALREPLDVGELQYVGGVYVKGLLHNGTHWLDLLRMLAGEPLSARGRDRLGEGGSDPTLDAELTLPGGAVARLTGLDTRRFTAFEMDLVGTTGRVRLSDSAHVAERFRVGDDPRHPGYRVLLPAGRADDLLRDVLPLAVADLARCAQTGAEPLCSGEDGAAAVALAEAIRASAAAGGEPVPVIMAA